MAKPAARWNSSRAASVGLHAFDSVAEARRGIGAWLTFYNDERSHQAMDYRTPREAFVGAAACGYVDNGPALNATMRFARADIDLKGQALSQILSAAGYAGSNDMWSCPTHDSPGKGQSTLAVLGDST